MESLYFNLSEEESSKGRKILLWSFSSLFLLACLYVLLSNLVLGNKNIPVFISLITFGISLFVGTIALYATVKRKDLFFMVNDEKIEFRYGIFKPRKHTFQWVEIKELVMPQKQKKAVLCFYDGTSYLINLNWLERNKSIRIRKHIYLAAKEKNLKVTRVPNIQKRIIQ